MLQAFKPPSWAKQVIVEGDAAYGAKANIKLVNNTFAKTGDEAERLNPV